MKSQNTLSIFLFLFGIGISTSAMDLRGNATIDLDSITYLEEEEVVAINFDTETYLPEGFNAYGTPENVLHVSYIQGEQEVDLGFDSQQYLPLDFNPYTFFFYIHSIDYIEDQEGIDPYVEVQRLFTKGIDNSIGR